MSNVTMTTEPRTRTVAWEDPRPTLGKMATMSGLEAMRAHIAGEIPEAPIQALIGFTATRADEGYVELVSDPAECHHNHFGVVAGGYAMTLIYAATACAVHTTLPPMVGFVVIDSSVTFTRPITRDTGRVVIEGRVAYRGTRLASAEARIVASETGKLVAHGTASCLIAPAA